MKVTVPFMAMASARRVINVSVPDDTPPDQVRALAEKQAALLMEEDEDVGNTHGLWEVHMVERPSIQIDNTQPLAFPLEAGRSPDDIAGGFSGIIPD